MFKASYSNHYRRGLIRLLGVLEFRSNNTAHQPVIDALALIVRHAHATGQYYPVGAHVVTDGAVDPIWADLLTSVDSRKQTRVIRHVYEACVFRRCASGCAAKRSGSSARANGETPTRTSQPIFETRRAEHYDKLHKPLDPAAFIATLREEMRGQLAALNDALPGLDWLQITNRKRGAIQLTPWRPQPEPRNLRRLKKAVHARWGQVPLIDMVTEAALRTGMLGQLTAVGPREALARAVLWERLLLLAYAYGTNTGISAVAASGHGHSEADLRYTARRHFTIDGARAVAVAARQRDVRRPPTPYLGAEHDNRRVGLHALPRLRPEPVHRVALPLRRARRADLLARREEIDGRALPADQLRRVRGRRDDRGRRPPRHHDAARGQLRRLARPDRDRVRDHPPARLRSARRGSSRSTRSSSTSPTAATPTPTRG